MIERIAFYLSVLIIGIGTFSCTDTPDTAGKVPNEKIVNALLAYDKKTLADELEGLTTDLTSNPISGDELGHNQNMLTLSSRLNNIIGIESQVLCYACVETLPALSEILIKVDSTGKVVNRVVDICTSADSALSFMDLHSHAREAPVKYETSAKWGCFVNDHFAVDYTGDEVLDTLYAEISGDTLCVKTGIIFNCCGTLADSANVQQDTIHIYIRDASPDAYACDCLCTFGFEHRFTNIWGKEIKIKVYLKGNLPEMGYVLWKQLDYVTLPI